MADRPDSAAWAVRSALRAWRRGAGEVAGSGICVALSGGADSLALTAAAVAEFDHVEALVVDHGLQEGSREVAGRAAERARGLGATARVVRVVVVRSGDGPEAEAREARYAALDETRDGRPVLLGHTLDDQAETVLLGLARGSGTRSLRGMTAWSEPWGRPLLGVRAAVTRAACAEHGLDHWDDPHNVDPAFTRVRLRSEVLPLMENVLAGGVAEALARSAELFSVDDDALETLAAGAYTQVAGAAGLDVAGLAGQPEAVRSRIVHRWLRENGVNAPTFAHVRAVCALVTDDRGRGAVAVGGSGGAWGADRRLVVRRVREKLEIGTG